MNISLDNKTLRSVMFALMGAFGALTLWILYGWSQGTNKLYNIGAPLGFIFLLLAMLVGKHNPTLYYILLSTAIVAMISALILVLGG